MKYRGTKKMKNKENPGIEKMRKTMGIHNRGMENLGVEKVLGQLISKMFRSYTMQTSLWLGC
jgi:hypothetical protein